MLILLVPLILLAVSHDAAAQANTPTCGGNRPLTKCCMGLAPWSTNQGVWGGICGYTPADPSELIGGRCITISSGSW